MKQPVSARHTLAVALLCVAFLTLLIQPARAQDPDELYRSQELAQMLAPIALYPDALLSQVLVAATYPIEVIEADRWLQRHPSLDEDDLDDALYDKEWDPSVKALCHFPDVLSRMSENISETTNLGNAFLAQEQEVMEMVQQLRTRAYQEGNLYSTRQQKVIVQREVIVIEPVRSRVVYVPYYDPYYVYGSWWYPDYPPYYWGPANVRLGFGVSFSSGISLSFVFSNWSYFDWPRHVIYINPHKRPRFVHKPRVTSPQVWKHVPHHRRGVAYRDKFTAQKYGQVPRHSQPSRQETRGYRQEQDRYQRTWTTQRQTTSPSRDEQQRNLSRQRDEHKRTVEPTRPAVEKQRQPQRRDVNVKPKEEPKTRHNQNVRKTAETSPLKMRRPADDKPVRQREQSQSNIQVRQERDDVFGRVDDGRKERQSSQRGKASRQHQSRKEYDVRK